MRPGTAVGPGAKWALAAFTVAMLVGAIAAGAASAAPAWLPAMSLGGSDINAESPAIAVAANGDAVAAWYAQPQSGQAGIQMATHPIGGSWQATVPAAASPDAPQVTIDASGDANVLWQNGSSIDVATAAADGTWSAPVQVNPGTGDPSDAPAMSEDAAGDVIVVFDTELSGYLSNYQIWWTDRPAGGTWSTPKVLVGSAGAPRPQISGDANGDVVLWWQDYTGGNNGNYVLGADVRPAGGSWLSPWFVSPLTSSVSTPDVVAGPAGTAHAIWEIGNSGVLNAADYTPAGGGSWSTPAMVSVSGTNASNPLIGYDATGNETLLWSPVSGAMWGVDAATRPSGGSWSALTTLLAIGDATSTGSSLSVSPSGQTVAGFNAIGTARTTTELSLRAPGGSWQPTMELSPYDSGSYTPPSLGQDAAGNVLAGWEQLPEGGNISAWAEAYDAGGGPVMTNPSIPSTGTVGDPVTFGVTPLGAWSPVVSTQWSFGDGAGAIDQTVSHTYSQPGKYTVTASAGDSQGNSSTSSGTITISAPAPATGGSSPVNPGGAFVAALPSLSNVAQSHARWRDGKALAKVTRARRHPKRPPVGTRLSFTVSTSAQVKFSFTQVLAGKRVRRRCVAPTRANRHARGCRRTRARGNLTYTFAAGAHHVSFDGRIGREHLGAGGYTVAISASNAAGHSAVKTLHFKIVR